MTDLSFNGLLSQAYQLYQAGQYLQALDLVAQEAGRFPDQAQQAYLWRICLASRTGKLSLATQLLREAVEAGYWYTSTQLHGDEDLKPLQGQPAFERLVAICRERQAAAQARALPCLTTLLPEGQPPANYKYPLLIALHADNANLKNTLSFWKPAVSKGWLLALPQSSQVGGLEAFVWDDHDQAAREIAGHFAALCEQYPLNRERIVVSGFSMGGRLAAWLALKRVVPARGFVAVGPYLSEVGDWVPLVKVNQRRGLRGYVVVGEKDVACFEGAQTLARLLKAEGNPCELEIHSDLGHDFPPDFERSLDSALRFIIG